MVSGGGWHPAQVHELSGEALRSRTSVRVAKPARATLRTVAPNPSLLVREASYRAWRRARQALLRRAYVRIVGRERAGESWAGSLPVELGPVTGVPAELRERAEAIRLEAEAALRHETDLLGSGSTGLGARIDWHRDFKSGYRWADRFYLDLEITRLDDPSDAKVPWDLSRGHQLLALARAARLFDDERYVAELEHQWSAWIEDNPPGRGINWANAMEVALRATNWAWVLSTVEPASLTAGLRERIVESLYVHGRHIAWNLEGTPRLRSNHHLADLLGLLALGAVLDGPQADRWFGRAHRGVEREVPRQVLADGMSFEASLGYHGLVLEMLVLASWVARTRDRPLSASCVERLRLMAEASLAVRLPNGRAPMFGDGDSGRVLPTDSTREPTHDSALALAAAELGTPLPEGALGDDAAWTFGVAAWKAARSTPDAPHEPLAAFPEGGVWVMRGGGTHLAVRCGTVGQNGNGGHAHNDALSFELSRGHHPFVVDSGTYVYTSDPAARDAFRSTAAHNGVVVEGEEINPLPEGSPFRLPQVATPIVSACRDEGKLLRLTVGHDGYRRLPVRVVHNREFVLTKSTGAVEIEDRLDGTSGFEAVAHLHISPGTRVERTSPFEFLLTAGPEAVEVTFAGDVESVERDEGWVSAAFGTRERAPLLRARLRAETRCRMQCRLTARALG